MTKTSLKEKLALLFGGLIFALILIELTLQGYGLFLERQRDSLEPDLEGKIRILALGESTTDAMVAPDKKAWTYYLQEKLKASSGRDNIVVINLGRAGSSTDFMVRDLPKNLKKYRPHLIITMIGINDWTPLNFLHSENFFSKLRTVRLIRTSMMKAPATNPPENIDRDLIDILAKVKDVNEIPKEFDEWLERNPDYQWYGYQQAALTTYWITRDHADWTKTSPDFEATYKLARKSLDLNPFSDLAFTKFLYSADKHKAEARAYLKQLISRGFIPGAANAPFLHLINVKDDPSLMKILEEKGIIHTKNFVLERLRKNYLRIEKLARESGARLAVMSYPTTNHQIFRAFFDPKSRLPSKPLIESVYADVGNPKIAPEFSDLIFISNENFPRGFDRDYYIDQMVKDGFGHTTKKGHELVAENAWLLLKDLPIFR